VNLFDAERAVKVNRFYNMRDIFFLIFLGQKSKVPFFLFCSLYNFDHLIFFAKVYLFLIVREVGRHRRDRVTAVASKKNVHLVLGLAGLLKDFTYNAAETPDIRLLIVTCVMEDHFGWPVVPCETCEGHSPLSLALHVLLLKPSC